MAYKSNAPVVPVQNRSEVPTIKWVKRAGMYCKTWFTKSDRGEWTQHQEWLTKEQYENLNKGTGRE